MSLTEIGGVETIISKTSTENVLHRFHDNDNEAVHLTPGHGGRDRLQKAAGALTQTSGLQL
jgi:hypothetical protein